MEAPRYTRDDVDAILLDSSVPGQRIDGVEVGELLLQKDAQPPHAIWWPLMRDSRKFRQSWERKRKDLKDTSASGYDLSLASMLVMAGASDQETTNCLIACRAEHGDDLKLRVDYYQRTLARARVTLSHELAVNELEKLQKQDGSSPDSSGDKRAAQLAELRKALLVDIQGLTQYNAPDGGSEFELRVEGKSIRTGQVNTILRWEPLMGRIAEACGKVIPRYQGERWRTITQTLMDVRDIVELGDEATERGEMRAWLIGYLKDNQPAKAKNDEVVDERQPYRADNSICFFLDHFQGWLGRARTVRLGPKELATRLRRSELAPLVIAHRTNGSRTTREVWAVPSDYLGEDSSEKNTGRVQE
jgi:hypothetical protein